MTHNNTSKLARFWENNINPVTGWIDEKRQDEKERSKTKVLDLREYLDNQKKMREDLLIAESYKK